jgi:hypothetical protein
VTETEALPVSSTSSLPDATGAPAAATHRGTTTIAFVPDSAPSGLDAQATKRKEGPSHRRFIAALP